MTYSQSTHVNLGADLRRLPWPVFSVVSSPIIRTNYWPWHVSQPFLLLSCGTGPDKATSSSQSYWNSSVPTVFTSGSPHFTVLPPSCQQQRFPSNNRSHQSETCCSHHWVLPFCLGMAANCLDNQHHASLPLNTQNNNSDLKHALTLSKYLYLSEPPLSHYDRQIQGVHLIHTTPTHTHWPRNAGFPLPFHAKVCSSKKGKVQNHLLAPTSLILTTLHFTLFYLSLPLLSLQKQQLQPIHLCMFLGPEVQQRFKDSFAKLNQLLRSLTSFLSLKPDCLYYSRPLSSLKCLLHI